MGPISQPGRVGWRERSLALPSFVLVLGDAHPVLHPHPEPPPPSFPPDRDAGHAAGGCLEAGLPSVPRRCSGWPRALRRVGRLAGLGGCKEKAKGTRWSVFCLVGRFSFPQHPSFIQRGLGGVVRRPPVLQTPVSPQGVLARRWKSLSRSPR